MKTHDLTPKQWADEFQEFAATPSQFPPPVLSESLFQQVCSDLNPPLFRVFSKLAAIHVAAGTLTLLFCPQFGVSPLGNSGLMPFLMQFGEPVCMVGCGALFMATSAFFAALLLSVEEVRKLRSREFVWLPVLSLFSLGGFVCLGGNVVLSLGMVWFLGSILGGVATLEIAWIVRRSSH